jgi:hypothetical protein
MVERLGSERGAQMNSRFYYTIVAIVGFVAYATSIAACRATSGDKGAPGSTAAPLASLSEGPTSNIAMPTVFADADLTVPEDFELEARNAIHPETYRAELTSLAREIKARP